jgi:hypothetical protein
LPALISPPARGVYTLDYYDAAGDVLLVAITSDGRRIAELPCKPDEAAVLKVKRILSRQLDDFDPVRVLRAI